MNRTVRIRKALLPVMSKHVSSISLSLEANAKIPQVLSCYCVQLMQPPRLEFVTMRSFVLRALNLSYIIMHLKLIWKSKFLWTFGNHLPEHRVTHSYTGRSLSKSSSSAPDFIFRVLHVPQKSIFPFSHDLSHFPSSWWPWSSPWTPRCPWQWSCCRLRILWWRSVILNGKNIGW